MSIDEQLLDWRDFSTAVAGVAGVLVGLLFVALALSPAIMKETSPPVCGSGAPRRSTAW